MKQIIFATGNPTKAKRFSKGLLEKGINVISLRDIGIKINIKEDGKDVTENALKKARECHEVTGKIAIGMDDSLYLENVPEQEQPGLFVRRINGKVLEDDEMIEHYTSLVKKYGKRGKLKAKWVYGLAVVNENGEECTYSWSKSGFYMVDKPSAKMNPGYPLNSISKYEGNNKYFTDVTEQEKEKLIGNEDDVVNFIAEHV